ncbi:CHAT domain-containing protein [Aerosakkonema sp. BLCC-F183]|uniref:CHAT domain-containing protein n=1 Tax=Aerosakkonema sp. BLCC-F183 TaxID=3342834 RepID=UPI0035B77944
MRSFICLALLTFLLVTAIFPAVAQVADFRFSVIPNIISFSEMKNLSPILSIDKRRDRREGFPTVLEDGKKLYDAGRFSDAVAVWEKAAESYREKNDRLYLALTLNYLSNAYQELGQWEKAKDAIAQSLNLLTNSATRQHSALIFAQALNSQGSLQLAMGQTEAALDSWKQAENAYEKAGDAAGILGSKINQAQALQAFGQYQRAKTNLENANKNLGSLPDSILKSVGLRSLGEALQVLGDLPKSEEVLKQSLALAQKLNSPTETSAALFSLGNHAKSAGDSKAALDFYQQAAAIAPSPIAKLETLLNLFNLRIETKEQENIPSLISQIQTEISKLNPSRAAVYAQVNFAETLMKLSLVSQWPGLNQAEQITNKREGNASIAKLLATAVQQARSLKDARAESYALVALGKLYQQNQQQSDAENLTRQALTIAQAISANDITARAAWQLGKILKQEGRNEDAIAAYTQAVKTLQILRSDLVATNTNLQFSFRESVEPVYRELVGLLLDESSEYSAALTENSKSKIPNRIAQARELIEALQLAELDNYFREACLNVKPQQIDAIDRQAAVIYPIILSDRLEVILSLPGKPLRHYKTDLPESKVESVLEQLLESINPVFSLEELWQVSQQVYDWLIRPAETDLATSGIKTLVFVLDGSLRNLPMSILYDGQKYLIEKYSIALTPGLQLLPTRSISGKHLEVLTAGLTESRSGFSALPGVEAELKRIASELPSQILLNQQFSEENLSTQIKAASFPIVHLATHGQFSSNPDETFILAWDKKLNVRRFEEILRSREGKQTSAIELLVLSACQTAAGDNRAALGLAGVALKSGARTTLATLWSVKDLSTATLITEFYSQLGQPHVTKAEALRRAQLSLLKTPQFEHPFYWSPFVLVGNWL